MYISYILHPQNKYYIGSYQNIDERLKKHNTNHAGFTGGAGDWIIKWIEQHQSKEEALRREKQIKNWKSRVMIEKLINA